MKKPETYYCDFCGKENPQYKNLRLPLITNCDWTEGRVTPLRIELENYDICTECVKKATNIRAGFQGLNPTIVEKEN